MAAYEGQSGSKDRGDPQVSFASRSWAEFSSNLRAILDNEPFRCKSSFQCHRIDVR